MRTEESVFFGAKIRPDIVCVHIFFKRKKLLFISMSLWYVLCVGM